MDSDYQSPETELADRYAVCVSYHFLSEENGNDRFRFSNFVSPQQLEKQVVLMKKYVDFSTAKDLINPRSNTGESSIILTFDDGHKGVFEQALPILRRYGVVGTVFVTSTPYLEDRVLDAHKLQLMLSNFGATRIQNSFYEELETRFPNGFEQESIHYGGDYEFYRYDNEVVRNFKLDLNYRVPYHISTAVIHSLFEKCFASIREKDVVESIYLTKDELLRLRDASFEIGIHTHSHKVLPRLPYADQLQEIQTNKAFLTELLGESEFTVAYPFGFSNKDTWRAMRELSMLGGFSLGRRLVSPSDIECKWNIPRYDVIDCFDKESENVVPDVFSNLPIRSDI